MFSDLLEHRSERYLPLFEAVVVLGGLNACDVQVHLVIASLFIKSPMERVLGGRKLVHL